MEDADLSELISPRGDLDCCTLNVALYAVNDFPLFVHHSGQILNMMQYETILLADTDTYFEDGVDISDV